MTDPEIFIVRIWRQLAGGFRASARRVDDEETRYFSRPDDVTRFLTSSVQPSTERTDAPAFSVPRKA